MLIITLALTNALLTWPMTFSRLPKSRQGCCSFHFFNNCLHTITQLVKHGVQGAIPSPNLQTISTFSASHFFCTTLHIEFCKTLNTLEDQKDVEQMRYSFIRDNVSFHRSALVQNWFHQRPQFSFQLLPLCPLFLNPTEEFVSAWTVLVLWIVFGLTISLITFLKNH